MISYNIMLDYLLFYFIILNYFTSDVRKNICNKILGIYDKLSEEPVQLI